MRNWIIILGILSALTSGGNCIAQPLKASLKFLSDTTTIGTPVKVAVTFKHPISVTVIFPDSTHDFSPFEFISKEYFPTKSDTAFSIDSAVYTLNTFELLPYLSLSIPLIYVENEDSTDFYTNTDEIFLNEVIKALPQQPTFKENTNYRAVDLDFNYPYLLVGFGALILIVGSLFLFFRKKITRSIRLYFIKKQFEKFIVEFDRQKDSVSQTNANESLETILSLWKKYLEKLESLPYTTFTSREIVRSIDFNKLYDSLLNLDRCIYGGFYTDDVHKSLRTLRDTAYSRYQKKTHELKHA